MNEKDRAAVQKIRCRKQRLSVASNSGKAKKSCPACGGPQPQYARQGQGIRVDWSKVTFNDPDEQAYCLRPFTASEIRLILRHVSDESYVLLGFNPKLSRPDSYVMTILVVPPPVIRPSITISEGSRARGQDDLTTKLCDIRGRASSQPA